MTTQTSAPRPTPPRLKTRYQRGDRAGASKEFGYANVMQVPRMVKVVVNMGVGDAARDSKLIDGAVRDLAAITGQKPQITKARKSIAQFKLREGMPIGAPRTLRGDRMWEFLDRLLSIALPRIRDFRGLSPEQFDGRGNYTFGLERAVDVPRDRPGPHRPRPRHGHHRRHHGDQRRRGPGAARQLGFPFKEN
jgi:large subunit ribosomal protein L5